MDSQADPILASHRRAQKALAIVNAQMNES
jgi:hypothetical protein